MKILLVQPHSYSSAKGGGPPIGLGYIAAVLIEAGHYVEIEDLMLTEMSMVKEVLREKLKKVSPVVVGITSNSPDRFFAFDGA